MAPDIFVEAPAARPKGCIDTVRSPIKTSRAKRAVRFVIIACARDCRLEWLERSRLISIQARSPHYRYSCSDTLLRFPACQQAQQLRFLPGGFSIEDNRVIQDLKFYISTFGDIEDFRDSKLQVRNTYTRL